MSARLRSLLIATAIYAAIAFVAMASQFAFLPRVEEVVPQAVLAWIILDYGVLIAAVFFVSSWVVRSSRQRGVLLPLLAWWLSSVAVTSVAWIFLIRAPLPQVAAAVASAATFRILTVNSDGLIPLFTLGDTPFGLGIPWVGILICASSYLGGRSERFMNSAIRAGHKDDVLGSMPNKHFDADSRGQ